MKEHLLQSLGAEEAQTSTAGVAVQYYRQVLQRKTIGAIGRELLILPAAIDMVARGRPTHALDLMIQRYKSVENTVSGVQWQVSQRLELLPPQVPSISELSEVKNARKEQAEESKNRWLAGSSDGRGFGSKAGGKGKSGGKEDGKRWSDKGKSGKGGANKGDEWKKEDDSAKKG